MSQKQLCWNCKQKLELNSFFCDNCGKIQSPSNIDEFKLFNVDQTFNLDPEQLEYKYLKLQQLFHPDKFSNSSEREKRDSTMMSSIINGAYKKLSNPHDRVNLLLKINGYELSSDSKTFNDKFVLEEIMEIQNKCMEIEDSESKKVALNNLNLEIKNIIDEISKLFEKKEFENVSKLNIKLSYLEKIRKNLKLNK
jgi:molecular chaperone HscB